MENCLEMDTNSDQLNMKCEYERERERQRERERKSGKRQDIAR